MPQIVQDGRSFYYESHGAGDPLILIRGLGSNADHWYAQVPDLSRAFRVITFDNRGIARSSDPGSPFTIGDMAADTIGLLDALQIEKAHVFGLSMGGMIAQEVALQYPQRVMGLVLAVTHCGGAHVVSASDEVMQTMQRLGEDDSPEAKAQATAVFFASRTIKEKPQILEAYAEVSARFPATPDILNRQMAAVAGHDTYDRLDRIQAPTLVLTAPGDILVPPENSKILARRIPNAQLEMVAGGGHQILIEEPQACNQAIVEFLKAL